MLELGAQGYSKAQIAAAITNGWYEQIDHWCRAFPSFAEAMVRARVLSLAWWEDLGQERRASGL